MSNRKVKMDEESFADYLTSIIHDNDDEVKGVATFEECGILTTNTGLVVRMKDGSKFQVTIVKER